LRIRLWRCTSVGWAVSTGHQGVGEEIGDGCRRYPGGSQRIEGVDQAAFARRRTGQVVGAAAADVVFVFRDVGQLQEVAEGADDRLGDIARQRVEQGGQFARRRSPSRAKRMAVWRTRSTMSKTASPSCSRTVSPNAAKQADVVAEGFFLAAIERVCGH
jgi:hypothetical protein